MPMLHELKAALRWRPEWPFALIVAAAWIFLLVETLSRQSDAIDLHGGFHHSLGDSGHPHATTGWSGSVAAWGLMTVAMMLPVTLPAVRHVAMNSIRPRRHRAMTVYVMVFVAIWMGFGACAVVLARALEVSAGVDRRVLLAAALATAALWQVTMLKRRAVFSCRRTVPLPPVGIRADAACARFAWRQGCRCIASCWALMVVMTVVGHGGLFVMAALTVLVAMEELTTLGPRLFRPSAALLGLAAIAIGLRTAT